jgi:hypothetical protein
MAIWTWYLIAYLCGVATPILIVRKLVGDHDDGSSCFLNILLWGVMSLILIVLWLGLEI